MVREHRFPPEVVEPSGMPASAVGIGCVRGSADRPRRMPAAGTDVHPDLYFPSGCQLAVPVALPGRYQGASGCERGIKIVWLQSPGEPPYRPDPLGTQSTQQLAKLPSRCNLPSKTPYVVIWFSARIRPSEAVRIASWLPSGDHAIPLSMKPPARPSHAIPW